MAVKYVTEADVNRLAQYLYEETRYADGVNLDMNMTGKPELVDALTRALARIGVESVRDPYNDIPNPNPVDFKMVERAWRTYEQVDADTVITGNFVCQAREKMRNTLEEAFGWHRKMPTVAKFATTGSDGKTK